MYHSRRIDDFNGSDAAYVEYLERQLQESRRSASELRAHLHKSFPCPLDSPTRSPANVTAILSASLPENPPLSEPVSRPASTLGNVQGQLQGHVLTTPVQEKQLRFVEYDTTRNKAKNENPQWCGEMDTLLGSVPEACCWVIEREKVGIDSTQNRSILAQLLPNGCGSKSESQLLHQPSIPDCTSPSSGLVDADTLVECAVAYGIATRGSQLQATLATKLALFQELIFVSFMVVLVAHGIPTKLINDAMKYCCKAQSEKGLERIRRGGLWANRCIGTLDGMSESGWGLRSTEIFLLCKMSYSSDSSRSLTK